MTELFNYHELYEFGKDKEVYEVVDSPVSNYVGTKVVITSTKESGSIVLMKEGRQDSDMAYDIVLPVGAITGAKYKKVERYKEIKLLDALELLNECEVDVYVVDGCGDYRRITRFTDLDDFGVCDLDDLMSTDFYIEA